jgi:hypothetical protein
MSPGIEWTTIGNRELEADVLRTRCRVIKRGRKWEALVANESAGLFNTMQDAQSAIKDAADQWLGLSA